MSRFGDFGYRNLEGEINEVRIRECARGDRLRNEKRVLHIFKVMLNRMRVSEME